MAITAISLVTSLVIVLLVGLLISLFSSKFKVPEPLFLILAGMGLAVLSIDGNPIIHFPELFLTTTAILALAIILFDSSTKIKLKAFNAFAITSSKLTLIFLVFVLGLFGFIVKFLLGIPWAFALLLAAMVAGTSADVVTTVFSSTKYKVVELLKFESIINTPITVILPFIIIDFIMSVQTGILPSILGALKPLIIKIVAGIGSGAVLFLLLYKLMNRKYSEIYTPLEVIVSAMLAFALAENIGGDGVLSVTTLGLLFGNFIHKKKQVVLSYESLFSKSLYVLVFVLIGLIMSFPLDKKFLLSSVALFIAYLVVRFIAISITLYKDSFSLKEKIFGTLQCSKGIATAALVLTFAIRYLSEPTTSIPHLRIVLDMALAFILYSLFVSTIVTKISSFFLARNKAE